jgi:ubiquinone/menaquinone biosynthesis C-methylase UbiE
MHINSDDVAKKYNEMPNVWPIEDKWHSYTKSTIDDYVQKIISLHNIGYNFRILNAGSGGETYGITDKIITHLDIAEKKIARFPNSIVSSIENIPIENATYDMIICVGSVVNYCDLTKSLDELSRVIKPGGTLIIEFESSKTMELIFNKNFNKRIVLIETKYHNQKEYIWYYSEDNVLNKLKRRNFITHDIFHFHILSSLFLRKKYDLEYAAKFAKYDSIFRKIPVVNKLASNVIIHCTMNINQ